jgi:hypothetical protein
MEKKSIFRDLNNEQFFQEEGYVLIDLLNHHQIKALNDIYLSANLSYNQKFYSSSFIGNMETKLKLNNEIKSIVEPSIQKHFKDYENLGSVFLIKPHGKESEMPIHQDWTVVNENEYYSATIWIPLQETSIKNGCLKVLPKSHKLNKSLRSPTLTDPISEIKDICEDHLIAITLKIGQAMIFNQSLIHSSFPNLSNEPRIAVAYGLIPKDADLIFYFKKENKNQVEVLNIEKDFFLDYPRPGERPNNATLKEVITYNPIIISPKIFYEFYHLMPKHNKNKSILNWLKKFLPIHY